MKSASIVVRGLDESVTKHLAAQAKEHGRSREAEVRTILTGQARRSNIGVSLMLVARDAGSVDDLPVPQRDGVARSADLE